MSLGWRIEPAEAERLYGAIVADGRLDADASARRRTTLRTGRPGRDVDVRVLHQSEDPAAHVHTIAECMTLARAGSETPVGAGSGEPTFSDLLNVEGDAVHLDVIHRWGNVVSATPRACSEIRAQFGRCAPPRPACGERAEVRGLVVAKTLETQTLGHPHPALRATFSRRAGEKVPAAIRSVYCRTDPKRRLAAEFAGGAGAWVSDSDVRAAGKWTAP